MDKVYNVYWSQTALDELAGILAYPPEVKERIYLESFKRLSYTPTLTAVLVNWKVIGQDLVSTKSFLCLR
ncbi:hypothetical protein M5X11_12065 [Paenibacillus alginolyticus]|uniref:hypothetical protein n=1 Tax=Paenibacillus alginolyticus TaxID=59839 RepID=UPI0004924DD0|nr:hypothetical protein [Paenibacillus alginolyticus]MCY9665690.1 hypothetical protein [Paenibacillus alginolyticus]